ncbi:uncharacterized protein BKA78DRAFT_313853 [Phyllosticta capitalensis]|uniref:C2H2-type domain-containing protein n=1 Tax=Phyllosticta capitalensis TaxID=121624 RepID=A0ABR1YPG1_9PEZI
MDTKKTTDAPTDDAPITNTSITEGSTINYGNKQPLAPSINTTHVTKSPEAGDMQDNKSEAIFITHADEHLMAQNIQDESLEKLPFSCDFCDKKFKLRSSKARHERSFHVAGGSSTFSCPFCARKFPRNDTLLGHARKAHNAELPHVKKSCGPNTTLTSSAAPVDQNDN